NNPRLLSQRGLFTQSPNRHRLEYHVRTVDWDSDEPVLLKYVLPDRIRTEVLEALKSMNINQLSLFPDLEGTATYCNRKLSDESALPASEINRLDIDNMWTS